MKEICSQCGMVANGDPWLHESGYGHTPTVTRDEPSELERDQRTQSALDEYEAREYRDVRVFRA